MSQQEPGEEELRAAFEEQMRHISVHDVLIQTVVTLINLGGRRLGLAGPPEQAGDKDLEQARLAIEGARALAPLLGQEEMGPVRDALAQLQMAYVQETQGTPAPGQDAPAQADAEQRKADEAAAAEEAERAKARAKIWTPPGA